MSDETIEVAPSPQGPAAPRRLTLLEARESPCATCASAPCCTHVPLQTFQIRTLRDLEHAIYLLNFERIVLGLAPTGDWSVYYRHPCRFLDRSQPGRSLCSIHGSELQPRICVNYSPYTCWYQRALVPGVSAEFVVVDRGRLEAILPALRFDEQRHLVETPDWPTLVEAWRGLPLASDEAEAGPGPEDDPVFEQWLDEAAAGIAPAPAPRLGYDQFLDPCTGCAAHCCRTLTFPLARPSARRGLDYIQFLLGFPGLEIGVCDGDGPWSVLVRSRCRHLTSDSRCGVFEKPERPSLCRYYDAAGCTYVAQLGVTRPRGFLRLRLEQFFWMVEAASFDEGGELIELPGTEALRALVEERFRAALAEQGGAG